MKAVWLETVGGPEVLRYGDRPDPVAGPGEVVVAVRACSLNHLDVWVRRGRSFPRPLIPGSDAVGTVCQAGPGVDPGEVGRDVVVYPIWVPGRSVDRLAGYPPLCEDMRILGAHRDGALAERVAVPAETLLDKPASLGWREAACLPIAFMTAYHMLFSRGELRPGQTALIHSAGSGVSHGAIQLAHMIGARVIATSHGQTKLDLARSLGADEVIDYAGEDVVSRVRALTQGRGVDVVLDHNGALTWDTSLACLARGGRLVICGVTQGTKVSLDLGQFFYAARSILGSTLGTAEDLARVVDLTARGRIKPVIDSVFALSDIRSAHERLACRERFGKVVVEVGRAD